MLVPHYGSGFPDGWTPRVREVVTAVAASDPYAAVVAADCDIDDVVNLAGLLVAALSAAGPVDLSAVMVAAAARSE